MVRVESPRSLKLERVCLRPVTCASDQRLGAREPEGWDPRGLSQIVDGCVCVLVPGVTDCQRNEVGLQCDQDGQYRASQRDRDRGKAFCVDDEGRRLPWSETEAPLTEAQCLSTCHPETSRLRGRGASPGFLGRDRQARRISLHFLCNKF